MMDRRAFLIRSLVAALAAPGTGACAAVVATRVTPRDGRVRLPLRNHPRLLQPGGSIEIQPGEGRPSIYVLAVAGEEAYVALSSVCTHLACRVEVQGSRIACPCHGSAFDRRGRVLRGPAQRPLEEFPVSTTDEGVLVIDLRETA